MSAYRPVKIFSSEIRSTSEPSVKNGLYATYYCRSEKTP